MVKDMIEDTFKESEARMCKEIINSYVVDGSWKDLELRRIFREILEGDENLKTDVENLKSMKCVLM